MKDVEKMRKGRFAFQIAMSTFTGIDFILNNCSTDVYSSLSGGLVFSRESLCSFYLHITVVVKSSVLQLFSKVREPYNILIHASY